jgi:AraC-like DNA-binding protein
LLKDNIGHHDLPLNRFSAICGLHPRHLQRILATQGTCYRQMKDEVRRSITEDVLANSSIPIAQIAQRVGLSGPSALDRAFKHWTGKTPTSFRVESTQKAKDGNTVSSASISTPDPRPPSVGRRLVRHRRAARPFAVRVHRGDQLNQRAPRRHPAHIGQKLLAPRALAATIEPARRQCLLLRSHRSTLLGPSLPKCTMLGNRSENP